MDLGAALNLVGALVKYLALAFVVPFAAALWYAESSWPFVVSAAITAAVGLGLEAVTTGKERVGAREGFLVVSVTWLLAAAVGALPYVFSGDEQLGDPLDAYFEAMSGFTTTGASVLTDFEALDKSLMLWRQFTQWLGGMGIIVLGLAVLPRLRVGGRQLFESEAPGPELEPLATSIRETARQLWLLYLVFSAALVAILTGFGLSGADPRMNFYEAVSHAFTTMPTGGFSTQGISVAAFGPATQWTLTAFMVIAGANFALMYVAFVRGRFGLLVRDGELRLYIAILALASALVFVELVGAGTFDAGEEAVRHSVFQVVSMMTTTGSASADFAQWTFLALVVLIGVMFIGGSAGSTAGSIKVVRHLLIAKILRRELDQTVHRELVAPIRLNRRVVDDRTTRAVIAFVLLYIGIFAVGAFLLMVDGAFTGRTLTPLEAIAAAATTLGNVGPGVGFAGPFGSFEPFGQLSKVVMILLMWLGRLEILPVIVLLTRSYWRA